jgi:hypothetical protein
MKALNIIIIFLYSLNLFCDENPFMRINEETRNVELAFRTYENKAGKKVKLIALQHIGDPHFFDKVRKNMRDFTVLYENRGFSLEDVKKARERINSLGGSIAEIQNSPELTSLFISPSWDLALALVLGLVHQDLYLKYDTAAELIHADIHSDKIAKLDNINDETLRKSIHEKVGKIASNYPTICGKALAWGYYCISLGSWLGGLKEKFFRASLNQHLAADKSKDELFHKRNTIVLEKLDALINSPSPNNIAIVYGALHAHVFEEFLLKHDFQLIDEKWEVLTSLDQL